MCDTDRWAAKRDDVADAIDLELLREGALLLDVLAFAFPKCRIPILAGADLSTVVIARSRLATKQSRNPSTDCRSWIATPQERLAMTSKRRVLCRLALHRCLW